jgi:hypothetical protein
MHENLTLFRQVERFDPPGGARWRLGNACLQNADDGKSMRRHGVTIGAQAARPDRTPHPQPISSQNI